MAGYSTTAHKGKTICIVDLSEQNADQAVAILDQAQPQIAKLEPKSGLILTDVTNAKYTSDASNSLKQFASKNTPYVKASAVVGAEGLRKILLEAVRVFSKRNIKAFNSKQEAMDWLAEQ